jgi:hypothetical protein
MTFNLTSPLHHLADLILNGDTCPLHVNHKPPSPNIDTGLKLSEFFGATLECNVDDCYQLAVLLTDKGGFATRVSKLSCLRVWIST